jgi:hypothetical protein
MVFWIVMACGLVGRYQRFGRTYCLHLQGPDNGGSIYLLVHTALQPRRQHQRLHHRYNLKFHQINRFIIERIRLQFSVPKSKIMNVSAYQCARRRIMYIRR